MISNQWGGKNAKVQQSLRIHMSSGVSRKQRNSLFETRVGFGFELGLDGEEWWRRKRWWIGLLRLR